MWHPQEYWTEPQSSYEEPVEIPTPDVQDSPTVCLELNVSWLPYVLGALTQLVQPTTWDTTDPVALADVQGRVTDLIALWGNAGACMQSGTAAVTILAGTAVGTAAVIFPTSFASLPDVVVSCDSGLYIAGKNSLSDTGFIATITARFAQPSNVSDVVTWIARLP